MILLSYISDKLDTSVPMMREAFLMTLFNLSMSFAETGYNLLEFSPRPIQATNEAFVGDMILDTINT